MHTKPQNMIHHTFRYKRLTMAIVSSFLLLVSFSSNAQKSVYDVIPGSGPKKQKPSNGSTGLPGIIRGDNGRGTDDRVIYPGKRRKHLPPGQAKKIYGGEAKDYAPGQNKKRKHEDDDHEGKHNKGGKHKD